MDQKFHAIILKSGVNTATAVIVALFLTHNALCLLALGYPAYRISMVVRKKMMNKKWEFAQHYKKELNKDIFVWQQFLQSIELPLQNFKGCYKL